MVSLKETDFVAYHTMEAAMRARIMPMLVGDPATSKTAMVKALAERLGYFLIIIVPSRMEPQDISGFPAKEDVINENGEKIGIMTAYAPQYWQWIVMEKKRVMVFVDEFSNTPPSVRASLLSFFQDRQFPNGDYLPEETILVGAMNPTSSAADGYEMDKATVNRMMFIAWKPTVESWLSGMIDNWGKGDQLSDEEKRWRQIVHDFIKENPGWLHNMDGTIDDGKSVSGSTLNDRMKGNSRQVSNSSIDGMAAIMGMGDINDDVSMTVMQYAWPSRRSWDNLIKVLASMQTTDPMIEDTAAVGLIGIKAASVFRGWLKRNNLESRINVSEIFADPQSFDGWGTLSHSEVNDVLRYAEQNSVDPKSINNFAKVLTFLARADRSSEAAPYVMKLMDSQKRAISSIREDEIREKMKEFFNNQMMSITRLYQGVHGASYKARESANKSIKD